MDRGLDSTPPGPAGPERLCLVALKIWGREHAQWIKLDRDKLCVGSAGGMGFRRHFQPSDWGWTHREKTSVPIWKTRNRELGVENRECEVLSGA